MSYYKKILILAGKKQLITTPVYGGAYLRSDQELLTHAVLFENDDDLRPLCKTAKNVMDDVTEWTKDPPSCPRCLPKWTKLKQEHPEYLDWEP